MAEEEEDTLLRSVAMQNAKSILAARYRAEQQLLDAQASLERRAVAVQEDANRLQLALSAGDLGDWSWDTATDLVTFGPRGSEIFGLPIGERVTWTDLRSLLELEDRERARLAVEKALADRSDYNLEYQIRRASGERSRVAARGRGVYAPDGTMVGMIGIVQDVTERKQTDERLRRSEEELRSLANSIPQLTFMTNADGHVFWYNRRWYEYTGTTFAEMEGWGWQSAHHPDVLPRVVEQWQASLESGDPFDMEFPLRGADGVFRWFLTRVTPSRDAEGNILRWFGTSTDVDEVRRTREALRDETRILKLLNKTGKTIGSNLDLPVLVQTVTDAATELSGAQVGAFFYNVIDARGESFLLYSLSGAPREAFEDFGLPRNTPVFNPTFRGDGVVRSADITADPRYGTMEPHHGMPKGHLPVRSYLAVPVVSRSGEVIGGLFFGHSSRDVFTERTERLMVGVAAQAATAIDNARLYETVKRAARDREQLLEAERAARSEAEHVNLMKDEFLATLSHELRTPLSAILGWSQLLASTDLSEGEVKEGLETIERNARAQTQLIEDLLDMNRIVSGKVRLDVQRTDFANVVAAAVESVRPSADAKGIRLQRVIDPHAGPVSGDPNRLQQVVWNLLSNAIKFTPKGGKVEVLVERVNSHLEVTVHDTGQGIAPEFLPHVFERFRQADSSTTRKYGGLGLGLAIVKQLVELHGGSVRAKSAGEGKGSTFIVNLPLAPIRGDDDGKREHPNSERFPAIDCEEIHLGGVKVLVVDDERDARELVKRVLEHCKAEVVLAGDTDEALQQLEKHRPDVIVSDIGMPGKDGYQFIQEVRRLPEIRGGKTPALAVTAFARSEDRTRAMLAGYQVHLSKPIEPQELLATVGSLAGRMGRPSD